MSDAGASNDAAAATDPATTATTAAAPPPPTRNPALLSGRNPALLSGRNPALLSGRNPALSSRQRHAMRTASRARKMQAARRYGRYIPQDAMRLRVCRTVASEKTRSPVSGQTPELARVAATAAMALASTSMEHSMK